MASSFIRTHERTPPKKGFEAGKWREISGWREKGEKNGEKN